MHMQIRCHPVKSPPDVEKLLGVLAAGGVNLVAVGGSDVEFGGEIAVVPEDGQEEDAFAILEREGYNPRRLDANDHPSLRGRDIPNTAGSLHAFVSEVSSENLEHGRIIRDILVGVPTAEQIAASLVPVHVYSELVRTPANVS